MVFEKKLVAQSISYSLSYYFLKWLESKLEKQKPWIGLERNFINNFVTQPFMKPKMSEFFGWQASDKINGFHNVRLQMKPYLDGVDNEFIFPSQLNAEVFSKLCT